MFRQVVGFAIKRPDRGEKLKNSLGTIVPREFENNSANLAAKAKLEEAGAKVTLK